MDGAAPHAAGAAPHVPRVTIGIPVYNAVRTLPLTLRSVFCQSMTDWELVLVDDGSTDGSVELMRALADDRVRVFADGENKSVAPRHNQITQMARAPFIARLDADDVMHPERLERQLEFMRAHPEVDVVGTGVYSVDAGYRIQGKRPASQAPATERDVALHGLFVQPTVLGKTEWFVRNPYLEAPEARRCEDAELWLRTCERSTFAVMPEPLLYYMEDPAAAIGKLRSSNKGRVRIMFKGRGEVRRKPLGLRLTVLAAIAAKMAFYELCAAVGSRQYLIDRRNQPTAPQEAEQASRRLEQIEECPLPGIDPPPAPPG